MLFKKTIMYRILSVMRTVVSGLHTVHVFLTATQKMALPPCSAGGKRAIRFEPNYFQFQTYA